MLIALHLVVFGWGVLLLVSKYRRGGTSGRRPGSVPRRMLSAAWIVLTHAWIRRSAGFVGAAHLLVFYGFVVLLVGTTILAFQDDVARPLVGFDFWRGDFYLGYSLFLDVFGAALVVGVLLLAVRRGLSRAPRLRYDRADARPGGAVRRRYVYGDWSFIGALLFLGISGFVLEALRVAADNPGFEKWAPLGWLLGQTLRALGVEGADAADAHSGLWWGHGIAALVFVAAIPYTKALHMVTGPTAVGLHDPDVGRCLPPVPGGGAVSVGYGHITDLSWQELVQLDACTKCGKCHVACPATAAGHPLSPRDLILDLREFAEGAMGVRASLGISPLVESLQPLIGNAIPAETAWACTQCMACVEICPVGIEHVPLIVQLRRRLVDEGEMDTQLQTTLEAIHVSGNSLGEPKRKRGRWTTSLPFEVKDIRREPADILWFVGDYASFDPRNQRATQALASVLRHAGVDFGILFDAERNAGCDVRRVGEEGLHLSLVKENIRSMSQCSFSRIVTSDPHSYHTLKNEYPEHGGAWEVMHHTQLILELLDDHRLVPARALGYTATYHDPCMLGRYNGVYEAPRRILERLGVTLCEMPRNRDNSFCCGAGGGRIGMKDTHPSGKRRASEQRIDEARTLPDVDYFVVACPKDVTMYEDAIKTCGQDGKITLREISELVQESLGSVEQSA